MEDQDLRYCKLCLVTDGKMFSMNTSILEAYTQLVQIVVLKYLNFRPEFDRKLKSTKVETNTILENELVCEGLQSFICYECVSLLRKYRKFHSRCITALNVLSSIDADHSKITREVVQNIDRKFFNLDSQLQRNSTLFCNCNDQHVLNDEPLLQNNNSDLVVKQYSHKIKLENKTPVDNDCSVPNDVIFESFEYVLDNQYYESDCNDYDSETKNKQLNKAKVTSNNVTQEQNLCSNEIVLVSDNDDYVSDNSAYDSDNKRKQLPVLKLKKIKINSTKSDLDAQNQKTSFTNEIVFVSSDYLSNKNDYVPENKTKPTSVTKLKKRKENNNKSSTDFKEQNTSVSDKMVFASNDNVIKKKRVTGTKLKKVKKTTKSVGPINFYEKFKLFDKDYVAIVLLTPDDSKKQVLLRKESTNYKNNPYKCDICYKGFANKLTFDNHVRRHSLEFGSLVCEYCHVRFTKRRCLHKHNIGCHLYKFSCVICPYVCHSYTQAVAHMNTHKGKKYKCNECGLNFSIPASLYTHKNKKHPAECTCKFCGSVFTTERGLCLHERILHSQASNEVTGPKCEECDVQFATETAFKRHLVLSSKHTVRNGCKHCGKFFIDEVDLKTHLIVHKMNRKLPAACKICGAWLTNQMEYESHMSSQHPKSKSLICEVCGKVSANSSNLEVHMITHSSERPYECRECGKTFKTLYVFELHKNMHTRERVFQCDLCQKEFTRKSYLLKHVRNHLGIRPYKCTICDKSFPHLCELRTHKDYVHFKKPWPKRDRTKRRT